MRRRELVSLLGGSALPLLMPRTAFAQKPEKRPTIGIVGANAPELDRPYRDAFLRRLGELGWDQNRNLTIEYRAASGSVDRAGEIAAGFVRLKVYVVLAYGY